MIQYLWMFNPLVELIEETESIHSKQRKSSSKWRGLDDEHQHHNLLENVLFGNNFKLTKKWQK